MNKEQAQKRLEEIAQFKSENRKTGQLWELKDNRRFNNLAVGYDSNNQIRFVTALAEKTIVKERGQYHWWTRRCSRNVWWRM